MASLRTVRSDIHRAATDAIEHLDAQVARRPDEASLHVIAVLYTELAPSLLFEPVDAYRRQRPLERALRALDDYDRSVDQMIAVLPETLACPPPEWLELIGAGMRPVTRARLAVRRRVPIPMRQTMLLGVAAHRADRRIERRLLAALSAMALDVRAPWQAMRRAWFVPTLGPAAESIDAEVARIVARLARHVELIDRALHDLEVWCASADRRIADALLWHADRAADRLAAPTAIADRRLEFLRRQSRSVDADIELETQLAGAEASVIAALREALGEAEAEHAALLAELERAVTWLEGQRAEDEASFPAAVAEVVAEASRSRALSQSIDGALSCLPESIEVWTRLAARRGSRRSWTTQTPRKVMAEALRSTAFPLISSGLGAVERQHHDIVQEIERAREVVAFARDLAHAGGAFDPRAAQEGLDNARSLLQFKRTQLRGVPPDVERAFVTGSLGAFDAAHRACREGKLGLVQQSVRHGVRHAVRVVGRQMRHRAYAATSAWAELSGRAYRSTLVGIGWMPAPPTRGTQVVRRGYLTHSLGGHDRVVQLPLIYQRLFRLSPVEDPRFLVGRDEELAAIADARRLWEDGRPAGVLLVGARGSGKTSLINCALQRELAGLDVVRSEFVDRLTTRGQMDGFLASLFGAEPGDLEAGMMTKRRVIVLEELERTFIRRPHGFEAVTALLGMISRTSGQHLWIVSLNQACFRLLNAAHRLEPHFSHRIYAMAAEHAHLREAILMRHRLSGHRLSFATPTRQHSYADRMLRATGAQSDPEGKFFEALFRESGGVFRTAFALWQRYIDRAEAGVLYMRYPARPAYEAVIESLDIHDLFTLVALQQHGSLTPFEHSLVFQIDEGLSRARLDNLLARELIELDPGRYGFRVVPEAAQLVRQTLFRRNVG